MTPAEHVKAIHVFNEKNPQPKCRRASGSGRAPGRLRFRHDQARRFADVSRIAEMSDGSFWTDEADVIVTLAACLEGM